MRSIVARTLSIFESIVVVFFAGYIQLPTESPVATICCIASDALRLVIGNCLTLAVIIFYLQ